MAGRIRTGCKMAVRHRRSLSTGSDGRSVHGGMRRHSKICRFIATAVTVSVCSGAHQLGSDNYDIDAEYKYFGKGVGTRVRQ